MHPPRLFALRRRPRPATHGQTLVEFALVVPLMLLLFMGIFDLGFGVYAYNTVANAAREGVRTAIVNQTPADIASRAAAQATALGIRTSSTSCPISGSSGVCVQFLTPDLASTCSPLSIGCIAQVTVKYTYSPVTPLISRLVGPVAITSTSDQPIESVCTDGTTQCPIP